MPVVRGHELDFAELPGRLSADPVPTGLGADYAVRVVRVPPGPRTPHLHPHSDEVTYVVSGSGHAWEDDVCTPIGPGDLVLVPRGAPPTRASPTATTTWCCSASSRGAHLADNLVELDGPVRD